MTVRPRAITVEIAIIMLLGLMLAALSLGLLALETGGKIPFGVADLLIPAAAGIVAAATVRATALLHRRLKKTVGGLTAAAALCATAAVVGALLVLIPSRCPGSAPFVTGRCGIKDASAWGQVAGLATLVNFMIAGFGLAVFKVSRDVVRDGCTQGVIWIKALRGTLRRRTGEKMSDLPRGPQDPKGRPTPRRADAVRTRRERSRGA